MTDEPKLTYEKVCEIWGTKCHTWALMDAVRLVHKLSPVALSSTPLTEKQDADITLMYEVALACIGESLSVMDPNAAPGEYRVYPSEFLRWVTKNAGRLPEELTQYVKPTKEKIISKPQARKIRCQAIAELIWLNEPDVTIEAMAKRDEIQTIACQGHPVTPKTIRTYIKHLCLNRSAGRRKTEN